jgi:uncharacterized membrane protein YphA (DoxX/SURF4 family)
VKYAVLAGRQLFSAIFIIASARHFSPQTIDAAAANVTMLGGALVISYFGAGPLSLDALLVTKEQSRLGRRDQATAPGLNAISG